MRPRHIAVAVATAALVLATGCGLADPMSTTTPPPPAATAPATLTTPDSEQAVRRFALAYVDLLNRGGAQAEAALRAAAADSLADGLILAVQDAQLAGERGASASTRLVTIRPSAGTHWRAIFATGATRWAMLVDVAAASTGGAIVTSAVTQPA